MKRHTFAISLLLKQDGIVLPVSLFMMLIIMLLGIGVLTNSSTDLLATRLHKQGKAAFYAAEGGLVYGRRSLDTLLSTVLAPSSAQLDAIVVPSISGFTFDSFSITTGPAASMPITSGPYTGLSAVATPYTITAQASGTIIDSGTARLTQTLQDQLVPLFQFGVFYNDDLEIFPGPPMVFNGRIHSNSKIYLGGAATVDSRISSAGDIIRCRKDNPSICSSASIRQPDGNHANLTYDHSDPNWATNAYSDWGGLVQDSAHGVPTLNLPVGTTDPADLIKRGDTNDPNISSESAELKGARMYWNAGLRIIDGAAYDRNGIPVDLTDGGTVPNPISTQTFYDYREGKLITATEVDVNLLQGSTNAMANLNDPPVGADPGIIYISETQDANNSKAVRLTNGAILPASGLSVATDNPVYVKGNYNTVNKKGAAIMGDAVTFLSNNWDDANAANASSSFSGRIATNTTVNAATITGNTTSAEGSYNGGLENLPRFLENWNGKTFTYMGSLVNLWQSSQANGAWSYGAPVYQAPNRAWSYDPDFDTLAGLPPGTPRVRTLSRMQWVRM